MGDETIRYDLLVQEALRGVVKAVVGIAARPPGLPGEHHVYITFATRHPGVVMPPALAGQYPNEMTIGLKQNFWELVPGEEAVTVGLYFNKEPQRLVVPWMAISRFFDPVAQVALQFAVDEQTAASGAAHGLESVVSADDGGTSESAPASEAPPAADEASKSDSEVPEPKANKVVSLDAFRKK